MRKAVLCLPVLLPLLLLSACSQEPPAENPSLPSSSISAHSSAPESRTPAKDPASSFRNQYGSPTTRCAHSGCTNYIASSGDTNCCTIHSSRCVECGKYIDEDALFCMDCIRDAFDAAK